MTRRVLGWAAVCSAMMLVAAVGCKKDDAEEGAKAGDVQRDGLRRESKPDDPLPPADTAAPDDNLRHQEQVEKAKNAIPMTPIPQLRDQLVEEKEARRIPKT